MAVSVRDLDSDAMLVHAAQAGDRDAFAELFRRHYPSVRRACARRLGSLLEGDEVAQAAFVRAWERIDRCEGDRRFGGWVHVIAQRLCFDGLRDRGRTTPTDVGVDSPTSVTGDVPEEALLRSETTELVHRALTQLPPRQRDVVVARDLQDRRAPEIAASLGLSVGAVDSLLLRGRRRLAEALTRMAGDRGATTASTSSSVAATAAVTSGRLTSFAQSLQSAIDRASYGVASALGLVPGASGPMQRAVAAAVVAGAVAAGVSAVPSTTVKAPPPAVAAAVPTPAQLHVPTPVTPVTPAAPAAPVAAGAPAVTTPAVTAPPAPAAPVSATPTVPVVGGAVDAASHTISGLVGRLGIPVVVGNLTR